MLKPVSRRSAITVVSQFDTAVDWDKVLMREIEQFPELRKDGQSEDAMNLLARSHFNVRFLEETYTDPAKTADLLIYKEGEKPTKFVVGVVPPEDLLRFQDDACLNQPNNKKPQQAKWWCFLAGVRSIENWGGEGEIATRTVRGLEYVDPAWLRDNFTMGLRNIALEIGDRIWAFNSLTDAEIKN